MIPTRETPKRTADGPVVPWKGKTRSDIVKDKRDRKTSVIKPKTSGHFAAVL
ncbi:hypothetical protein [Segatella baroniae]|uniref:hypothetical protein n=1 Tax=Segatella baroniae TaxID=305719 RepID=UPI000429281A|nr:hypothetical protein [Segatella baroniae]